MKFRIISIPPFKAVCSEADPSFNFEEEGILGKFNQYFSTINLAPKDNFTPRDYLYYDKKQGGLVWMYALTEDVNTEDYPVFDFDGGFYLTYFYMDGDHAENERLYNEAMQWIEESNDFDLDERDHHYAMGHIITPAPIIDELGIAQMETFIPVKCIEK